MIYSQVAQLKDLFDREMLTRDQFEKEREKLVNELAKWNKRFELKVFTMADVVCNFFIRYLHKSFKDHGLQFIALLPN